jgi:GNAT superfamily N-acetyltransferase
MALNPWDDPPMHPQQLRHPRDIWAAAKQIDGLGGEWTYQVFNHRALNFHLSTIPPFWAESLSGFDYLMQEMLLIGHAMNGHVPRQNIGSATAAFEVFPSVFSATSDEWPMPEEDEQSIGRHTVSILGIVDKDTLLFQHRWSSWPKDYASGRLTREYIDNYGTELWVNRPVSFGPRASTVDALAEAVGTPEFAKIWASWGRRGVEDIEQGLQLRWWESYSLEQDCPGEVVCLVAQKRIRVAVAMVIYGPAEATIIDLFVWPGYRRLGYARLLEASVADRARRRGVSKLNLMVLDADIVKGRTAAVGLLESCGYDLTEYANQQVQISGVRALDAGGI